MWSLHIDKVKRLQYALCCFYATSSIESHAYKEISHSKVNDLDAGTPSIGHVLGHVPSRKTVGEREDYKVPLC